jgi:hypothetical protein
MLGRMHKQWFNADGPGFRHNQSKQTSCTVEIGQHLTNSAVRMYSMLAAPTHKLAVFPIHQL